MDEILSFYPEDYTAFVAQQIIVAVQAPIRGVESGDTLLQTSVNQVYKQTCNNSLLIHCYKIDIGLLTVASVALDG